MFDLESGPGDRRSFHSHGVTVAHIYTKMDFPKFDGDDYQIWLDNCELYFEIYGVSAHMKVKFASLNMIGNDALWLKTYQKKKKLVHWIEMCEGVRSRWGRSKHTFCMRQLLVMSQLGSIEEYTTLFNTLKHQILLEDPDTSEVLFVERYIA